MQDKDAIIQAYIRKNVSLAPDRFRGYLYDESGNEYFRRFAFFRFKKYVQDFLSGQTTERFFVLSGLRGTGKTTLIAQIYIDLLKAGVPQSHMLYVSMDEVSGLMGCSLADVVQGYERFLTKDLETLARDERIFLFIDEAHYDPDWPLTLKSVYDRARNVFIFVTGSSALSLVSTTDVARRATVETLFPLTYLEYNMLKQRFLPPAGLKNAVEDALFDSSSAREAFERLGKENAAIADYLSKVRPMAQNEYLKYGTLPFAIPFKNEEGVYGRIVSMLEKVVFQDLGSIGRFTRETGLRTMNLLTVLASSDRVNYDKLAGTLGVSRPTLSEILDALEKADLIFKVWPHGSASVHIRKTPKYKFTAPAIRTALLWNIGRWTDTNEMYGSLLEDVVAMHLHRLERLRRTMGVEFDPSDGCADFILTLKDRSSIVIEVGYGHKGVDQMLRSAEHCRCKYGIVIANDPLELRADDNIVIVPKELFLLA